MLCTDGLSERPIIDRHHKHRGAILCVKLTKQLARGFSILVDRHDDDEVIGLGSQGKRGRLASGD
jgi:hypothetical protein